MSRLALFDLDNTLLGGDSDHAWGEFMVVKGMVDDQTFAQTNDQFYQDYVNGTLNMYTYNEFILQPLTEYSLEQLQALHNEFMQQRVMSMILSKGVELIKQHEKAGDTLAVITATSDFVTKPIVEHLGIDHLIATTAEIVNGQYTGKISGTPCFAEGKISKLENWLDITGYSLVGARFYSDSFNDIPLLGEVDEPVAVDPDERLREHAQQANWPIISLRY